MAAGRLWAAEARSIWACLVTPMVRIPIARTVMPMKQRWSFRPTVSCYQRKEATCQDLGGSRGISIGPTGTGLPILTAGGFWGQRLARPHDQLTTLSLLLPPVNPIRTPAVFAQ